MAEDWHESHGALVGTPAPQRHHRAIYTYVAEAARPCYAMKDPGPCSSLRVACLAFKKRSTHCLATGAVPLGRV